MIRRMEDGHNRPTGTMALALPTIGTANPVQTCSAYLRHLLGRASSTLSPSPVPAGILDERSHCHVLGLERGTQPTQTIDASATPHVIATSVTAARTAMNIMRPTSTTNIANETWIDAAISAKNTYIPSETIAVAVAVATHASPDIDDDQMALSIFCTASGRT